MAIPIPLLIGRREGGHGLCLSPSEKGKEECGHNHPHPTSRRKVGKWPRPLPFYSREGEKVMATPTPLLVERKEGGHSLCLSPLEK